MTCYVGRFAPSPSGPLHLGSLFTAIVSYLDAKAHDGQWLVRIEDIDPPREMAGASQLIIDTLAAHGLVSDQPVLYQSAQHSRYLAALEQLFIRRKAYFCTCTRAQIKAVSPFYQGQCRQSEQPTSFVLINNAALRYLNAHTHASFVDRWQGPQQAALVSQHVTHNAFEDCVLRRKDGLFAYNLAVVLDDIAQGVTHIVRGVDLLPTTLLQRLLWQEFSSSQPHYAHCPVLVNTPGNKLSKQNHAPAINPNSPLENILQVYQLLDLPNFDDIGSVPALLAAGVDYWRKHPPQFAQEMIVQ